MGSKQFVFALAWAAGVLSPCLTLAGDHQPHWSYRGHDGPEQWSHLEAGFSTCGTGKAQSPVDIRTRGVTGGDLSAIQPAYQPTRADIVNNGHTIQIDLADGGTATLPNGSYKLQQFHFHTPSEEAINGKRYPLVAHMVHQNEAGELAVIAVLFKLGAENTALREVFAHLPHADGKASLAGGFDAGSLLPGSLGYYAFQGSLTTPPCSEGVAWHVLKQPVELSERQLAAFKRVFRMNARPLQALNQRKIVEVN